MGTVKVTKTENPFFCLMRQLSTLRDDTQADAEAYAVRATSAIREYQVAEVGRRRLLEAAMVAAAQEKCFRYLSGRLSSIISEIAHAHGKEKGMVNA